MAFAHEPLNQAIAKLSERLEHSDRAP
jgi:hypothetical protein